MKNEDNRLVKLVMERLIKSQSSEQFTCKHEYEKLKYTFKFWFLFFFSRETIEYLVCKKCGRVIER